MKKSELIEKLSAIAGDPEVGIGYWDMSMKLAAIQESTSGGIYEQFIHLVFGNEPLELSVGDTQESISEFEPESAPEYTWDEKKMIEDPNGNNIKCYVIKKDGVVLGYMRNSQAREPLSWERAQSRNTRFQYFKMTDDAELLQAAKNILGGPVWGTGMEDDGTGRYVPLFYIG